jgi:hypothetical protein
MFTQKTKHSKGKAARPNGKNQQKGSTQQYGLKNHQVRVDKATRHSNNNVPQCNKQA